MVTPSSVAAIRSAVDSLRAEQAQIGCAVDALEGLLGSGRGPKHQRVATKKTRHWSAAQRKAVSDRMKAYWAAKRAQAA